MLYASMMAALQLEGDRWRLPVHLLERIKTAANSRDVPYQSLIKVWLEENPKKAGERFRL